jgi:hypothetical protein
MKSMDEVRCPMCSKKNPADAESCEFCGARIKPLIIQKPSEDVPSKEKDILHSRLGPPEEKPREEEQVQKPSPQETDWLNRMRLGVTDEGEDEFDLPEEDSGPKRGETDLLGRFRDLGISSDEPEIPKDKETTSRAMDVSTEWELEPPQEAKTSPERDRILPESQEEQKVEPFVTDKGLLHRIGADVGDESDQEESPVPDWLVRIRAREEEEKPETPKRTGDTDWLTGLRDVSFRDEDEEEELPEALDEFLFSDVSPDLGKALEPSPSETPIEEEIPSGNVDEEMTSAQASIENLFSELDQYQDEAEEESVAEPSFEDPSSQSVEEDLSDLDDLFKDFDIPGPAEGEKPLSDEFFTEPGISSEEEVDDLFSDDFFTEVKAETGLDQEVSGEDFLGRSEEGLEEEEEPLLGADFFADLGIEISDDIKKVQGDEAVSEVPKQVEEVSPPEAYFDEDFPTEPSGIRDLAPGSDVLARESFFEDLGSEEITPPFEEASEGVSPERSSLSDLLGDFSPSWMDDTISDGSGELPHVPALILDDEMPPLDTGAEEGDLTSVEIPDWLQDLGKDVEEELIDDEDDIPVLAKATLPPWLEAMRPIETFRATPEIELELEEEEEIIEAAGPLAGLKGVLLAEPVVAMPRTPITALGALDISDRDLDQADILQQMVEEEEKEESEYVAKRTRIPILRWVSSALLVLAVLIPSVLGGPEFGSPTRAPRDLSPFLDLVQGIPVEKPVLLVFDYAPSYSAEMDAVAGALVENLFARDQTMVTMSTQPSGPMLADRMLRRVGKVHQAVNGEQYIHLGYLSGGPAALQLLTSSPPEAFTQGFNLPEEFEGDEVWDSPILANIHQLSDFAMVAVLTSGTESARIWAEQVHPQLGTTPMVMVLSAGVEPIIQPYYEAQDPQIDGILSGLPSAMIYEQNVNGLQADAAQRWNGYGLGLVVAVMILLAGTGYGIASWIAQSLRFRHS